MTGPTTTTRLSYTEFRAFTEPRQEATYDDLCRVARAAETLGFDSFVRTDRYLDLAPEQPPGPIDAWTTLAGLARVDWMMPQGVELGIGATWRAEERGGYDGQADEADAGVEEPGSTPLRTGFADEVNVLVETRTGSVILLRGVRAVRARVGLDSDSLVHSTTLVLCGGRDDAEAGRRAVAIADELEQIRDQALAKEPGEQHVWGVTVPDLTRSWVAT
jgi:hypothetical protein